MRTLDTPKIVKVAEIVTAETFDVKIVRNSEVDLGVDRERSGLLFVIGYRDANGVMVDTHREFIPLSQWPETLREKLKAVRDDLEALAELAGVVGSGTKSPNDDLD